MVRSMNGIYPLLAVLCWSGNIIVTRLSAGQIEPGAMAFYRWLAASVVMTPFLLKALLKNS